VDKLRIKIQVPEGMIDRDVTSEKRIKTDADYTDVGWRILGVPFGGPIKGRDLDGEAFHEDTDIWLKVGDQVNITYYHGYGPDKPDERQVPPVVIGRATYVGTDKRGHWFDPMLDYEEPLAQRTILAGTDKLKASSGAISHLVRMGKGGLIDVWPVGELAIFDTNEWRLPANDFAVIESKSVSVTEMVPEASEEAADVVDATDGEIKTTQTIIPEEELEMTDEILEPIVEQEPAPQVDIKSELDEMKKSILDELKAMPGQIKGKVTAPAVVASCDEIAESIQ